MRKIAPESADVHCIFGILSSRGVAILTLESEPQEKGQHLASLVQNWCANEMPLF